MTRQEAENKFKLRLDNEYLKLFENGKLLVPGNELKIENLNTVYNVVVDEYDMEKALVTLHNVQSNKREKWTLDNLFILNYAHFEKMYNSNDTIDFGLFQEMKWSDEYVEDYGIYILHNKTMDDDKGFYVGQAKGKSGKLSGRLYDHKHDSSNLIIDKEIHNGVPFSIKVMLLSKSGYSNIDALEAAGIAYFMSYKTYGKNGYNGNRGQNCAGSSMYTKNISK